MDLESDEEEAEGAVEEGVEVRVRRQIWSPLYSDGGEVIGRVMQ